MTQSSPHWPENRPVSDKDHRLDPAVLATILASSPDCIQIIDRNGNMVFANETGRNLFGIGQEAIIPWAELWPDGREAAVAALLAAQQGETGRFTAIFTFDGGERYWDIEVHPIAGADKADDRLLVIGRDTTERWQLQQALRAEAAERNHRIKNQMAVVQSIVNQTLRGAYPPETAKKMIAARLDLLARAHDLLIHSPDERPSIHAIVDTATQMLDRRRLSVQGPDLPIGPKAALSLSLLLHELASNAATHGAFSTPQGRGELHWGHGELEGEPAFELVFIETDGPPVTPPSAKGFGTRLLQGGVSGAASTTTLDFHPQGVRFRLVATLAGIQARN